MRKRLSGLVMFVVVCGVAPAAAQPDSLLLRPGNGSCGNYRGGLRLVASASPDMGGIAPAVLVPVGTTVRLHGIAERLALNGTCVITSRVPVPFQWGLIHRSTGGQEMNIPAALSDASTLAPRFRANDLGVYFATLTAERQTFTIRIETVRRGHGWVSLGPIGIAPPGSEASANVGRVNDLAFDPQNHRVVYASTAWGGVFKSNSAGADWIAVTDGKGLPYLSTGAITVTAGGTVFVGLGDSHNGTGQFYPLGSAGELWRSDDGGGNWRRAQGTGCSAPATDLIDSKVTRIFSGSRFPLQVMVATFNGVFRSMDGGECWQRMPGLTMGKFTDLNFDPRTTDTMWVAQAGAPPSVGVALVSGAWSAIPTVSDYFSPSTDTVSWVVIARAPSNPARTYVAIATTNDDEMQAKVVRIDVDPSGAIDREEVNSSVCSGQCNYNLVLAVHPLNDSHVLFGEVKPHHSTNGGEDFGGLANNGSAHDDFHVMVFPPGNFTEVFAGTDGGVFRLGFGGSAFQEPAEDWEPRNAYLSITQAGTLSNSSFNRNTVALGAWDNGSQQRTADRTWTVLRRGDGYAVSYDATPEDRLYVNRNAGKGSDTIRLPSGKSFDAPAGFEANPYVAGEVWGQRLNGKSDSGAYVWTDATGGWRCADPAPAAARNVTNVDFTPDGHYYTGADDGSIHRFTLIGLTLTDECGASTPLTDAELVYREPVGGQTRVRVSVDPFDFTSVYAVLPTAASSSNRVAKFTKTVGGWAAVPIAATLPANAELNGAIAADPQLRGVVYVASQHGLWAGTPDASGTYSWAKDADVPETSVTDIQPQRGAGVYTGVLRLATFGRGIWERKLSSPCTPITCVASVRRLPCLACRTEKVSSGVGASTELILSVPVPDRFRASGGKGRYLRVTPSIDGRPVPYFLTRASAAVGADEDAVLADLTYLPPATGPAGQTTDALVLELVDIEGRPIGLAETIAFRHTWRRVGASVLRVTAFEHGPVNQPRAVNVAVQAARSVGQAHATPLEVTTMPNDTVSVRWSDERAWEGAAPQCFLNGESVPYRAVMTVKMAGDQVLVCGTFDR